MNEVAQSALELETQFLSGVKAKFRKARGQQLTGSVWRDLKQDQTGRLRALMQARRIYDRDLLKKLPHNRRTALHGYERSWWLLGKQRTVVAVGSFLCRLADYLPGSDTSAESPPIDLPELLEHVRSLVVDGGTEHVIGICSPHGFTERAKTSRAPLENIRLVLIEPRADGGWAVQGLGENVDEDICELFDPEGIGEKIQRVRREIERRSADLLTAGLSAATIQEATGLEPDIVEAGFEAAAGDDPELHLARQSDAWLLYRGAPVAASETADMSIPDFIKQLFGGGGDEARQINHLSEQRASLSERQKRIFDDIAQLEQKETDLLEQGKLNKSATVRRRVASQISQLRKDIGRLNSMTSMLGQQINIVSTHIHNLTLIQQGKMTEMPEAEELTQDAVRAEEMLESLKADADMVGMLDTGVGDTLASEEEQAILAEFDEPTAESEKSAESPAPASESRPEETPPERQQGEPEAS